jgi:phytoene dehydrogenase-like protein
MADAVVIGAGPNGLVAANKLADAGWEVVVLEAQPEPGGAVRSAELTLPGYVHDRFSAFYPLGAGSRHIASLGLERHGLRWRRAPVVVADPADDGSVALLSSDLDETCASVGAFAAADAGAWRELTAEWGAIGPRFVDALLDPFPPLRGGARLVRALGPRGTLDFARFGLLSARRFSDERFHGAGAARLLAGNAMHADISPETPGGAVFAMVLVELGQRVGWPVPEGGAGRLTDALVARLRAAGGRVVCGERVERVLVRRGRAIGVRCSDGRDVGARRAVLADVGAPQLYVSLLEREHVPARVLSALRRFQYDSGTVKVDWALDGPIPWAGEGVARAGVVHVTGGVDALSLQAGELERGRVPSEPFLIVGQYAHFDPTRQPAGHETAWAYTHVPQRVDEDSGGGGLTGAWDRGELERMAERVEERLERVAPGFRGRILARHVVGPRELEAADANLVGGALNGGTAQLHQQLVFRPIPGLGRAETPIRGLYLASASAHPGGGVHGACGANAAHAALVHARLAPRVIQTAS